MSRVEERRVDEPSWWTMGRAEARRASCVMAVAGALMQGARY